MPRSPADRWRQNDAPPVEISAIAATQHGVVTVAQLLARVSETTVRRWVARGTLHRVHRGVYAVGHAGLSREGRWMAAVLAAGDGAALSHLSAAEAWRVSRWPCAVIDVVSTRRRKLEGVKNHSVRRLDERDVTVWAAASTSAPSGPRWGAPMDAATCTASSARSRSAPRVPPARAARRRTRFSRGRWSSRS
ncbi:type IV toxin-antitoxin system AbiEi family antitoxin domain-containing protein [Solirubrobacter sp. CPCC 204708]|nr:type IV toxin-antitoxin system AbiEi family antitoxin domain-containing protein [Solirubrobacter deserti]